MANTKNTVLHSWVSPRFAREVQELAERDGRTVSNLIRVALRDRLQTETSPTGESAARGGPLKTSFLPRPGADASRED